MCNDNFTPDKKALKEMNELQGKKEELLFLSLCSESDYNLLKRGTKPTLRDFERLLYLARHLGFQNYCIAFENQHPDLLMKLGCLIEYEVLHDSADIEEEHRKQKHWEDEFLGRISDARMRDCLKKLFHI